MRPWLRRSLYALAALLLLLLGVTGWVVAGFDGDRIKRVAIDWMQVHHSRALAFDGPMSLRLWPLPAVTVKGVRLSEPGQPGKPFASIAEASLALRLEPLLARREIEVASVSASGVKMIYLRGADGRRNIDDLLATLGTDVGGEVAGDPAASAARAGSGGATPRIESITLNDAELQMADDLGGVQGRLQVRQFSLGAFGPGLSAPLRLRAQAELTQPELNASLELDGGLQLLPSTMPGAPPLLRLDKAALHLQGAGFDFEGLDARLSADALQIEDGPAAGLGDSRIELDGLLLRFSGARLGWRVDGGELGLAKLRLGVAGRKLELDGLLLKLKGRKQQTTLDARLSWPVLRIEGDGLHGGPVEGSLALGGDQRLQLTLKSSAPSGAFERITLPGLRVDVDGSIGPGSASGQGEATLVLEPSPFTATLAPLSLALRLNDPSLPPLQVSLDGQARLTASAGSGAGGGHDQRAACRRACRCRVGGPRPSFDVVASFGTLDLSRFTAPARRGAAPAPTAAATPVDLRALQSFDARLQLTVARLLRPPYRIDGLEVRGAVDNGVLELRRLAGRAWGGRFDASGRADAGSGALALRLRAEDVDLRALLSDTAGLDGLRGRGRIDADLNTRGATVGALRAGLNGRLALALQPAAVRGFDLSQTLRGWRTLSRDGSTTMASDAARQTEFKQLGASFDVRQGVARSTDLDGRSDFLDVAGEGTIDLAQGRIDYLLRARVVNTAGGRAGPEMVLLNGVTVPVELQGPFGDVQWQVRWAAVTAAVAARSVPNAARGAVGVAGDVAGVAGGVAGGVVRGAGGLLRGAAGAVRGNPAEAPPPATPGR